MDIPAHILDAVQTSTFESSLPVRASSAKSSPRKAPSQPNLGLSRSARSSTDDISSISSESEQEHGYQTDFTSLPSEASPEDMQPDDVEDFRDREYPQLKGKTYLDHGGTTVWTTPECEE
jgi:molybdenum cofactor sulfurtransferase